MADKKATRESYGQALCELGEKYDFLVLDADLAAATKTGMFKKKSFFLHAFFTFPRYDIHSLKEEQENLKNVL